MSDAPIEADLLDQTLYIAGKIYDDPGTTPIPLDLHSACAIGSYDSVYDAISSGRNINVRNKGISNDHNSMLGLVAHTQH